MNATNQTQRLAELQAHAKALDLNFHKLLKIQLAGKTAYAFFDANNQRVSEMGTLELMYDKLVNGGLSFD